jgi:hypothetical protein
MEYETEFSGRLEICEFTTDWERSSSDGEPTKGFTWIYVLDRVAMNVRPEIALQDCFEKLFDFLRAPLDLDLHPAIREICYPSRDVEALSDLFDRKTEADPLDPTLKKSTFCGNRFHG